MKVGWYIVIVQLLNLIRLCDPMDRSTPGFPVLHYLPELAQICVHRVSDTIWPSHSQLPPFPFPLFQSSLASGSFPVGPLKYQSFSFSISPSDEYSGLISFSIDWFDLLAVQRTLKSLLQHHTLKASILPCSTSFIVQLSHPYMTTGKAMSLSIQTFVGKVMPLLFNTLSRFVIAFLPRSKCFLISFSLTGFLIYPPSCLPRRLCLLHHYIPNR